jgi:hypothetical protein
MQSKQIICTCTHAHARGHAGLQKQDNVEVGFLRKDLEKLQRELDTALAENDKLSHSLRGHQNAYKELQEV